MIGVIRATNKYLVMLVLYLVVDLFHDKLAQDADRLRSLLRGESSSAHSVVWNFVRFWTN